MPTPSTASSPTPLVVDYIGIFKADVGIKNGMIAGVAKAGNPDVMRGVTPGRVFGVTTEVIAGENLILTDGGIDVHFHYICPQQPLTAIGSGITTLLGGGTGPATGSFATTCRGNSSMVDGLPEQILAGAAGLKLHED